MGVSAEEGGSQVRISANLLSPGSAICSVFSYQDFLSTTVGQSRTIAIIDIALENHLSCFDQQLEQKFLITGIFVSL